LLYLLSDIIFRVWLGAWFWLTLPAIDPHLGKFLLILLPSFSNRVFYFFTCTRPTFNRWNHPSFLYLLFQFSYVFVLMVYTLPFSPFSDAFPLLYVSLPKISFFFPQVFWHRFFVWDGSLNGILLCFENPFFFVSSWCKKWLLPVTSGHLSHLIDFF